VSYHLAVPIDLRGLETADLPAARALLAAACAFDPAAEVAEEKLYGPAPAGPATATGAFDRGALIGLSVASGRWVRLLAVAPAARGRGVGTALLAAAESAGGTRTMDQPGNYLAPGVALENAETLAWLERRGYRRLQENTNLLIDVRHNPLVNGDRARDLAERCSAHGYQIRRAGGPDRAQLAATVQLAFGRAWAFEVERAGDSVHIALAGGEIAAFAAHDGNNRGLGWFGPAGTLEPHRGRGLGEALLLACLVDVAAAGVDTCTVAWIGPRAFYQRAAGIAGERRFIVLAKEPQ
jgi:ribosomal protein S18 acetylase RimI-like enzyme